MAAGNRLFSSSGLERRLGSPGQQLSAGLHDPPPPNELTHAAAESTRLRPAGMRAQRSFLELHNAPQYHVPGLHGRVGRAHSTLFLSGRLGGVVVQSSLTWRDRTWQQGTLCAHGGEMSLGAWVSAKSRLSFRHLRNVDFSKRPRGLCKRTRLGLPATLTRRIKVLEEEEEYESSSPVETWGFVPLIFSAT